ncbi:MAG: MarR family transcriptional regulator [Oscillospiraceae bacterium]|nr:MarR family transcriptional regulator [Oscillospiraceae bacterium]
MPEYQLEIKQIVDYPRCRIYREFVQTLIADRSIRTNGGSGLFYFTVLCSYANFRTSYRRLDGITYTVYPGEWVCRVSELAECFRVRFQYKVMSILQTLQDRQLITFTKLGHGNLVKYSIKGWRKHNTVLDYNCPCQKESGFFFMPVAVATELISYGRASEMDVVLDLWISAIYKDNQVRGSDVGPVVYLRNGTGNPLLNYSDLAQRWGLSRSTVGRLLKKLADQEYLTLMSFPGRTGSVIYLNNYLSTMFQVSDVMVDKDEVAMSLNVKLQLPEDTGAEESCPDDPRVCVSKQLVSVSKSQVERIVRKVAQVLETQGVSCFNCPKSTIKLYPLSGDCMEAVKEDSGQARVIKIGMVIQCGNDHPLYSFELTMTPTSTNF